MRERLARMVAAVAGRMRRLRFRVPDRVRFGPGDALRGIGGRLRSLRYVLADLLFVLGRIPRSIGRGVARFWRDLPIVARRRLVAAVGVGVAVLLMISVVVPNLPCAFPGGDECPPHDDAIELAPAGALAYLHANLDPETEQAELATELAARTPEVSRQVVGQLATQLGIGTPLGAASEPWFGGEAAAVVIGTGRAADRVQLLEANDEDAARAYAESLTGRGGRTVEHGEVEIVEGAEGQASAVVEGFLVLGTPDALREVIDVANGAEGAEALADDEVAERVLDELPDHRVAEAYLSADGVAELVGAVESDLATLEPLVDADASRGAGVALSAGDDGYTLAVRSLLDAERSESGPGFFAAFESFEPELPEDLPGDSLAYVGLGGPGDTIAALLEQATVGAPGIAQGVANLIRRLRRAADFDLQRDLLEAFGDEVALAVVPPAGEAPAEGAEEAEEGEPLPPAEAEAPYLEFLAGGVNTEAALDALARLQEPIAGELDPDLGAPVFREQRIGELDAQVLRLSPVAQLVYAARDSQLVIANDTAAIERLAEDEGGGLAEADRYERAVADLKDEPALLAYLDVRGLIAFAERSGLAEDTAYSTFAPDLRRLDSLGLAVRQEDQVLATDARLLVD